MSETFKVCGHLNTVSQSRSLRGSAINALQGLGIRTLVMWTQLVRRNETFYLMMHLIHFIYSYMVLDKNKEGRKCFIKQCIQHILFAVIWRQIKRKEMFYLMMHSTHFICSYMASDKKKEGNVLFNDALNTL